MNADDDEELVMMRQWCISHDASKARELLHLAQKRFGLDFTGVHFFSVCQRISKHLGFELPFRGALESAALSSNVEFARELIAYGMRPNEWCSPRALEIAASNGCIEIVRMLILDAGMRQTKETSPDALMNAAHHGHKDIVLLLLDSGGASATSIALFWAAHCGHGDVVRLLLDRGACPSSNALKNAARNGHTCVVKDLLAAGAKFDRPETGCDALYRALFDGHTEISSLLIAHDVAFGALRPTRRTIILNRAERRGWTEIREMLRAVEASEAFWKSVERVKSALSRPNIEVETIEAEIDALLRTRSDIDPRWDMCDGNDRDNDRNWDAVRVQLIDKFEQKCGRMAMENDIGTFETFASSFLVSETQP